MNVEEFGDDLLAGVRVHVVAGSKRQGGASPPSVGRQMGVASRERVRQLLPRCALGDHLGGYVRALA